MTVTSLTNPWADARDLSAAGGHTDEPVGFTLDMKTAEGEDGEEYLPGELLWSDLQMNSNSKAKLLSTSNTSNIKNTKSVDYLNK